MATTTKNRIRYGLKNVHYAVIDEESGVPTYGTPKKYNGAVTLTLDPNNGDPSEFNADDIVYYVSPGTNKGYTGTLEMASGDSQDDFNCDVLGFEKDANGNVYEPAEPTPKKFALLWEFSGDKNGTRYVAYNCTATRASISGETFSGSVSPAKDSYSLTVIPSEALGAVQLKCPTSSTDYADFFKKVVTPTHPGTLS